RPTISFMTPAEIGIRSPEPAGRPSGRGQAALRMPGSPQSGLLLVLLLLASFFLVLTADDFGGGFGFLNRSDLDGGGLGTHRGDDGLRGAHRRHVRRKLDVAHEQRLTEPQVADVDAD